MVLGMRAAVLGAVVLVLAGVALGLGAARLTARPAPSTTPPAATGSAPLASAAPSTEPLVFAQPLAAGCATERSVWVFADGGGIGRFADDRWSLADPTLRSLVSAACTRVEAIAVGPAGRIVTADEGTRTVSVDSSGLADLRAVAALPDGSALAAGAQGTVLRRDGGWRAFARGIEEDLLGVAYAGAESAWLVGADGAAYRLDAQGWRSQSTGLALALRAVAASTDLAVAVGDDGALLRWRAGWTRLRSGTTATLRSVALSGTTAWVGGDGGTALRVDLSGERSERIDLGSTCRVRDVFTHGDETWFVASEGSRAGVWRLDASGLRRWGGC